MLQDISGADAERRIKALICLRFVLPYCKTCFAMRMPHVMAVMSACSDNEQLKRIQNAKPWSFL